MSTSYSPRMVTDGLQLYYDVANIKSFPGEPTTNEVVNPIPDAGWSVSNYLTSAVTQTFETLDGEPVMKLTGLTYDTAYPRLQDSNLSSTITTNVGMSFEVKGSIGDIIDLKVYEAGSTKITLRATLTTTDWERWTYSGATAFTLDRPYIGPVSIATSAYIKKIQFEQKAHVTPWVNGTRSTTDGIKDLSGQGNHADLANATYDSDAKLDLDGTAGYFVPSSTINLPANADWTVGMWVKTTENCYLMSNLSGGPVANSLRISGNKINYYHYNSGWYSESGTSDVNDGNWHYLMWVNHTGSTIDLYVDGVGENMGDDAAGPVTGPLDVFGKNWSTDYMDGKIDVIQYYNSTALTSAQALQNFNALKGRFGL